jgi:hypothetical protein
MKLDQIIDDELYEDVSLHFNDVLRKDQDAEWCIYDKEKDGTPDAVLVASGKVNAETMIARVPKNREYIAKAIGLRHAVFVVSDVSKDSRMGRFVSLCAPIDRNFY